MVFLFQCAIGPVQDFIATARRSRDLWYGSWMLSELSKAAAQALAVEAGIHNLIFPAPQDINELSPDTDLNVANRVVAVVQGDPVTIGEKTVQEAIAQRLKALQQEALSKVRGGYDNGLATRQLADLVEYYWVCAPMQPDGYASARVQADALLAARKTTRNFSQAVGKARPKSSLDGARESVIQESAYPDRKDSSAEQKRKTRLLYQRYGARRGERLSAVDLLKRHGKRGGAAEQKFKSTSHMAALPFLAMIDREKGAGQGDALLAGIMDVLRKAGLEPHGEDMDGSLLFASRLREWTPDDDTLDQAEAAWSACIEKYAGKRRPEPYYALLRADGDFMGRTIDAQNDPARHRELLQALSRFALAAKAIVVEHDGVPVYTGGDDVLAYLPLHTALTCIHTLDKRFTATMSALDLNVAPPTLSAGLVVTHHLAPLSDALELAKQAEQRAKSLDGKHGLAITLSKRSGADRTIVAPLEQLTTRMDRMIAFTRAGAISKGAAYDLQELHRVLGESSIPPAGLAGEALRIVARKRESGGAEEIGNDVKQAFDNWLLTDSISVHELAQELIVAAAFAGATDLAEGSPTDSLQEVLP